MQTALVRYGAIPEVARFATPDGQAARGEQVVVRTHRGLQLGTVLEQVARPSGGDEPEQQLVRVASPADREAAARLAAEGQREFDAWCDRVRDWNLNLEIIDLEWTLDREKLIVYVLSERGPECTKLALQAAAAGLGVIEVQPVSVEGLAPIASSGCGQCGH